MFALLKIMLDRVISKGNLTVIDAQNSSFQFGDGSGAPVVLKIKDSKWEKWIALNPALKLGEAYMEGGFEFIAGDIAALLRIIFAGNDGNAERSLWLPALLALRRLTRSLAQMNNLARSGANIRHHYDLSARLYALFLDPDRQYSCAYFEQPGQSLAAAQLAKKRHLAAKLCLEPQQKLLDIGCGWGGLGLYLARFLQADVTGVTLSREQHSIAQKRAEETGLSGQCRFLLKDYRLLQEKFDRLVSVGMFEHVGAGHYKEYFAQAKRLLKPDGIFVLHSIGRSDGPGSTNPFIRKYIFPGGYIPALSEVLPAIERSGLIITDIEILRLHYADTLKEWRKTFLQNWDKIAELYDERFCRMWDFYLAASESAFRRQHMMVFQIQMAPKQDNAPLTRDYIYEAEARLRQTDSAALTEKGFALKIEDTVANNSQAAQEKPAA